MPKYTIKKEFTDKYEKCTYEAGETAEFSEERAGEIKLALGEDALVLKKTKKESTEEV